MKIEHLKLEEIIPYARNPRKNEAAVVGVAASIKEFGWTQPIVVDAENVIVAGHTRFLAAQKLGLGGAPVVRAEGLTPEQIKAYRILDNKLAEAAEWNSELLALELDDLADFDFEPFDCDFSKDLPKGETVPAEPGEGDGGYKEQYGVIIECETEEHQEQVFNQITELGYKARVVCV